MTTNDRFSDLVTVAAFARCVHRSPRTVRRWLQQNLVQAVRIGRGIYIRLSDVKEFEYRK